jgi:hypothetical protein
LAAQAEKPIAETRLYKTILILLDSQDIRHILAAEISCEAPGVTVSKLSIIVEFWQFLRVRKKWWLIPILVSLLLLGALIVFAEGSALSPWLYTFF